MSNWGLIEIYKLNHLGDDWSDCYIKLKSIPYPVISEYTRLNEDDLKANPKKYQEKETELMSLLKENFFEGKIFNGEKVVNMKKSDFDDIPSSIMFGLINFLFQASTPQTNTVKSK